MTKDLNEFEINEIKSHAKEKLGLCRKGNDITSTGLLSEIFLHCRKV